MIKDVAATAIKVHQHLGSQGFAPRDADSTDLAREGDASLRFKVGTAYREVTVMVMHGNQHVRTHRCINDAKLAVLLNTLNDEIRRVDV